MWKGPCIQSPCIQRTTCPLQMPESDKSQAQRKCAHRSNVLCILPLDFQNPGQGKGGRRKKILNRKLRPLTSLSGFAVTLCPGLTVANTQVTGRLPFHPNPLLAGPGSLPAGLIKAPSGLPGLHQAQNTCLWCLLTLTHSISPANSQNQDQPGTWPNASVGSAIHVLSNRHCRFSLLVRSPVSVLCK